MTKQEIIERFREKFHRYTEDDPRDVMLDTMSGGIEDFWLSLRDEELKEIAEEIERSKRDSEARIMQARGQTLYNQGLQDALSIIHKRME